MKFAFSSSAFRHFSLSHSIEQISRLGYGGIEIMCDVPHAYPPSLSPKKINKILQDIKSTDLEISNLNAFMLCAIGDFHHPSWIEIDEEKRMQRIQHTIDCVKLAKALGVGNISTEPGGPLPKKMNRETAMDLYVEGINQALPIAQKLGVKILVEPEPRLMLQTGYDFLQFISRIDSNDVALNFDIGHFYCVGEDVPELIKELKDYIVHFHLEDIKGRVHNHLIPGDGCINFRKIFSAINDIGYEGFVTVELYPYTDNPVRAAKIALNYLRGITKGV
ncbi:MAG: sugar phosphate isomerase/epimerase family protein [Nitrososphaerales archaeon]